MVQSRAQLQKLLDSGSAVVVRFLLKEARVICYYLVKQRKKKKSYQVLRMEDGGCVDLEETLIQLEY